MTMLQYCHIQGKVRYPTYWSAMRVLRVMIKKAHHNGGSCYLCLHCHSWHITHFTDVYEFPFYYGPKRLNKKQKRSQRVRSMRLWYPAIPLREYIKAFNNQNLQEMTQDEFDKFLNSEEMRMAYLKLNAASLLADVIDSFLMDAYSDLAKGNNHFKQEYKRKWKNMTEAVRMAKAQAKQCSHLVYKCDDVDAACNESDLLADLLLTILQRTNDASNEAMEQSYKLMKATIIKNFKNLFIEHKKHQI